MATNFLNIEKIYNGLIEYDYDISELTTWKIGGKVKCIVFPQYESQIVVLIDYLKRMNIPYYIIGKGSNILFGNNDYNGLIIYLGKKFDTYEITKDIDGSIINCLSGMSLMKIGKIAKEKSLTGFEYLSLIPGSLGGAIITNAEAHKKAISDLIISVKVLENGMIKDYTNEMCMFKYRTSIFEGNKDLVVLSAILALENGNKEEIINKMLIAKDYRIKKQPKKPSAGSVFKNPNLAPAGKLIDDLGLKGVYKGDAKISNIHGNFIINEDNAKSEDVLYLIKIIRDKVEEKYKISLDLEIKMFNI